MSLKRVYCVAGLALMTDLESPNLHRPGEFAKRLLVSIRS